MKVLILIFLLTVGGVIIAAPKPVPPSKVGVVKKDVVKKDKALTSAELAEVDAWVSKKVKSGFMTKKQGDEAMKHPEALKKVMDSEKKPKKGVKKNGN